MKIVLASDHRGFALKEALENTLREKNLEVIDLGNDVNNPTDDYPDYAHKAARLVAHTPESRGIVLCGSGVGVDIAANKTPGIRCGLAINKDQVISARKDDDINMLALAADYLSPDQAVVLVDTFLSTPFEEKASHTRRIEKIENHD